MILGRQGLPGLPHFATPRVLLCWHRDVADIDLLGRDEVVRQVDRVQQLVMFTQQWFVNYFTQRLQLTAFSETHVHKCLHNKIQYKRYCTLKTPILYLITGELQLCIHDENTTGEEFLINVDVWTGFSLISSSSSAFSCHVQTVSSVRGRSLPSSSVLLLVPHSFSWSPTSSGQVWHWMSSA